ncbi:MAG: DNA-protecting protein DprA [Gemmatimonadetes bacterium]|nr:DNA-protecting protein DprA [Gemmatimonadota bacterium]
MSAFELLLLEQLPGVGPATVRRLVRRFGDAGKALEAADASFAATVGGAHARASARARRDPTRHHRVRDALKRAAATETAVVSWDDDLYPAALHHLADPPPVLFLAGRLELLRRGPTVAVVGARRSTARARDVAGRLGTSLGRNGVTVVSGLALGVDGAAHAGALRAEGDTIAVLGAGVDVPYPRFHRRLHHQIRQRGLLVSEFPPGTNAAPHHFPRRNRLLAALSGSVVVVEAGDRSGALITVDHALDLGRDVWAVPGPIDTRVCVGSNRLLAEGARPFISVDAFVAEVGGSPTGTGAAAPSEGAQLSLLTRPRGLDPPSFVSVVPTPAHDVIAEPLEHRLLRTLEEAPAQADELARRFEEPISTILAVLTTLELHGEVERLAGMRFRRAA